MTLYEYCMKCCIVLVNNIYIWRGLSYITLSMLYLEIKPEPQLYWGQKTLCYDDWLFTCISLYSRGVLVHGRGAQSKGKIESKNKWGIKDPNHTKIEVKKSRQPKRGVKTAEHTCIDPYWEWHPLGLYGRLLHPPRTRTNFEFRNLGMSEREWQFPSRTKTNSTSRTPGIIAVRAS